MFEWVSTKSKIWPKLPESRTKCYTLSVLVAFSRYFNHRLTHMMENTIGKLIRRINQECFFFAGILNFYWVFKLSTTPTNVWVSFNQIQNIIEIARINHGPKAIALVSSLFFYRYFKWSAIWYVAECFAKLCSECSSPPQLMFELVSSKSKIWPKLPESIKDQRL